MSDIGSSLPIRSESDGTDARVHTKIVDYTSPSAVGNQATVAANTLYVRAWGQNPANTAVQLRLSEAGNVSINGLYNVTTNSNPSSGSIIGHTRGATPAITDQVIRITAASPTASGITAANVFAIDVNSFMLGYNGTTWDRVTTTNGALNVNADLNGVYNVSTNPVVDNVGIILNTRAATPDNTTQTFRPTGGQPNSDNITPANVYAQDTNSFLMGYDNAGSNWDRIYTFANKLAVALFDENGAVFSSSNPLPVTFTDSEGAEVNNYNTSAALAGGATANHDYTVSAATTLKLSQIQASASGKLKITLQVETGVATAVFSTIGVFFNSTANPNIIFPINENITVAAGVRVRLIRQNNDLLAQDVYSLISGHEV